MTEKFKIEYKVARVTPEGTETRQVKKVTDDLPSILAAVQDATAPGGGLEYLSIRRVQEPKPKPPKPEVKK